MFSFEKDSSFEEPFQAPFCTRRTGLAQNTFVEQIVNSPLLKRPHWEGREDILLVKFISSSWLDPS